MIGIDLGNHQRNILLHAERRRVAHDGTSRIGKERLQLPRNPRVQRGENHLRRTFRPCRRYRHRAHKVRDRRLQPPADRFFVGLAFRTIGRGQPRHFEPGMIFQQLEKALTYNTGRAENSDGNLLHRHDCKNKFTTCADETNVKSQHSTVAAYGATRRTQSLETNFNFSAMSLANSSGVRRSAPTLYSALRYHSSRCSYSSRNRTGSLASGRVSCVFSPPSHRCIISSTETSRNTLRRPARLNTASLLACAHVPPPSASTVGREHSANTLSSARCSITRKPASPNL